MADIPPINPGAEPLKKSTGRVQPKKETVRINLPPKPTAAPTIKLPTLPPGGPTGVAGGAMQPPPAGAPALRSSAAPAAARSAAAAPAAPATQRPASRPAAAAASAISQLDKMLAIAAGVVGLVAIVTTVWMLMMLNAAVNS